MAPHAIVWPLSNATMPTLTRGVVSVTWLSEEVGQGLECWLDAYMLSVDTTGPWCGDLLRDMIL